MNKKTDGHNQPLTFWQTVFAVGFGIIASHVITAIIVGIFWVTVGAVGQASLNAEKKAARKAEQERIAADLARQEEERREQAEWERKKREREANKQEVVYRDRYSIDGKTDVRKVSRNGLVIEDEEGRIIIYVQGRDLFWQYKSRIFAESNHGTKLLSPDDSIEYIANFDRSNTIEYYSEQDLRSIFDRIKKWQGIEQEEGLNYKVYDLLE